MRRDNRCSIVLSNYWYLCSDWKMMEHACITFWQFWWKKEIKGWDRFMETALPSPKRYIINQAKGKVKSSIHLTSIGWCLQASTERTSTIQLHRIITSICKLSISCNLKLSASASCSQSSVAGSASRPSASRTARTGFSICRFLPWLFHERKGHNIILYHTISINIIQYPQSLQSLRSPSSKTLPCCYCILQSLEF